MTAGTVLRVGLTGNIAAGKSTVAGWLAEAGCEVIDADALGHACLEPGRGAHDEIVEAFGEGILRSDGAVDREELGRRVFSDPASRRRLEEILHPRIATLVEERIDEFGGRVSTGIAVVEAALLIETGMEERYHRLVVVAAAAATRLRRLVRRGLDEDEARRRMAAQIDAERQVERADYVIRNDGDLAGARKQTEALLGHLRDDLDALARGAPLPTRDR